MFRPPKPLAAVREKLSVIKTGQDLAWYAPGPPRAHGIVKMEAVIETINEIGNIINDKEEQRQT
jgi:hypothetical protein